MHFLPSRSNAYVARESLRRGTRRSQFGTAARGGRECLVAFAHLSPRCLVRLNRPGVLSGFCWALGNALFRNGSDTA